MGSHLRWKSILDSTATVLMICASAAILWTLTFRQSPPPPQAASSPRTQLTIPFEPVSIEGASRLGRPDAPVVVIAYSDFQCPFCAEAALETLPAATDKFVANGAVQIVFRHFPLDRHAQAFDAAKAAECAAQQGHFWQMHDTLFRTKQLDSGSLFGHAAALKLDSTQFSGCFAEPLTVEKVRSEVMDARALGITGTPTFFLGKLVNQTRVKVSQRLSGSKFATIAHAVEMEIKTHLK